MSRRWALPALAVAGAVAPAIASGIRIAVSRTPQPVDRRMVPPPSIAGNFVSRYREPDHGESNGVDGGSGRNLSWYGPLSQAAQSSAAAVPGPETGSVGAGREVPRAA